MQQLNRSTVSTQQYPNKILQFGEGNFLRAFVDWMVQEMNEKAGFNAGVTVVQPIAQGLGGLLNEQEGLYNLFLKGLKNGQPVRERKLIECLNGCIDPYQDYPAFLKSAEADGFRFVISNTTEAGITFNANDRLEDAPPASFPAKLTAWLYRRFNHFDGAPDKGVIIIPCELIDKNGEKLKTCLLQYAEHWQLDPAFVNWLQHCNTFCNTLVDRIVPGFPKDEIDTIYQELGYEDKLVSEGEQFHLWVIEAEDRVAQAFPAEKAGLNVIFTDDQSPYRTRKVRILNGAHTTMVPVGYLCGFRTVRDVVEDETMGAFIRKAVFEEIIPTLDLPKPELQQFAKDVIDRFLNPYVQHYLISISLNSFSKYKTRVLPSVKMYLERKGALPERLVLALACLLRFYEGTWKAGEINLKDDADVLELMNGLWEQLRQGDIDLKELVKQVLAFEKVWGEDLNQVTGLGEKITHYLQILEADELEKTVGSLA